MSPRFKTLLPAIVVLVVGMAGMAYLKYWERSLTSPDLLAPNPEQQAQLQDAEPFDDPESETGAVPEPPPDRQSDAPDRDLEIPRDTETTQELHDTSQRQPEPVVQPDVERDTGATRRAETSVASGGSRRPADREIRTSGTAPATTSDSPRSPEGPSSNSPVIVAGHPEVGSGEPQLARTVESSNDVAPSSSGVGKGGAPPPGSDDRPRPDAEPQPETTPLVRMIPSSTELVTGDAVSIIVDISSAADVGHVPFHLNYNAAVLEFEYGEQGSFLGSDGVQTAFFATASRSAVVVGLSRLGRVAGVNGGGDLCVLHFTAVGPGNAALGFSRAKVRDSSNRIVPSVFAPAVVVVH